MEGSTADRRARQQERREQRSAVTDPDIVLAAGAALLGVRSRTTHELRVRLVKSGYPHDLVDVTIDRLLALGYMDDEAYARAWVGGRDRSRPRGAAALRRELLRKGLGRELVDAALHEREQDQRGTVTDGVIDPDDTELGQGSSADHAAAVRLLDRRRSALLRESDPRRRRQRAYALLARNGFDPGVCMDVTRAYLQDADEVSPGQV